MTVDFFHKKVINELEQIDLYTYQFILYYLIQMKIMAI